MDVRRSPRAAVRTQPGKGTAENLAAHPSRETCIFPIQHQLSPSPQLHCSTGRTQRYSFRMREPRTYCFYIMASRSRTLYCGVSGTLPTRVRQHKTHALQGFTDDYNVERLVYFERYLDV